MVCGLLASLVLGAEVTGVKSVYLLPMSGGLDQYLANRLTAGQVFRVVTDPKLADAIFTDQLGEAFERKFMDLYPPPEAADSDEKDDNKPQAHASAFGRGKGTIFLVDLKSRAVIWSGYEKRSGSKPEMLDRTAVHIVQQIKKLQKTKQ
jgi:hypothetical protein